MEILIIGLLIAVIILLIVIFMTQKKISEDKNSLTNEDLINANNMLMLSLKDRFDMLNESINTMTRTVNESQMIAMESQKNATESQNFRLKEMTEQMSKLTKDSNESILRMSALVDERLEKIRLIVDDRLKKINDDNSIQLDKIRDTVDEKLQKTLEDRISKSFKLVSEKLDQVYMGLGEMQTVAAGVGDLKKVLSNVKTRGILGEIQLGAILEQILTPDQYDKDINTRGVGAERVEFAVKLPGDDNHFIYLPIDSKFPGDTYANLMDAYETGDKTVVATAKKNLITAIKKSAKDIRDKYIAPPNTTEFAVMFLPFEGLYAEVVNLGMIEELQRDFNVNIAGPTTMASLLNSLQMGFRTLSIQKHSSEVWKVLGSVKTEFKKFESAINNTQKRLEQAQADLETLVGVRTRQMNRQLEKVTEFQEDTNLLEDGINISLDDEV
ncbi:MAG: DNA recombination protein RmuC [Eubacteriales bacterium]|nr:DNA recombination protein RmuC [Eubacteriales bacterium]MDY3332600.1 DNA recombination protein RmuC [Gallibacter sp.]